MSLDKSINKKIKISISAAILLTAISVQSMPVVFARECVEIAFSGTLMRGLQLEPNLVNLKAPPVSGARQLQQLVAPQGSTFIKEDRTMPEYRLYSINDVNSAMVRVPANATNGVSVVVEVWCYQLTE